MNLNDWLNSDVQHIAAQLEEDMNTSYHVQTGDDLNLSGRLEIYSILDELLAILFPGAYCSEQIDEKDIYFFLYDKIRHASYQLYKHIHEVFVIRCKEKEHLNCNCEEHALRVIKEFMSTLPMLRKTLFLDIQAAYEGDPAANSLDEVVLSYPYIDAIATHRLAHKLYMLNVPIIPRIMSERAHSRTGIDIHPGATIGEGFFIDHGTGVVIGETSVIGRNVKIYQGVTLGALSPFDKEGRPRKGEKRHPDIEDDVILYANATILGGKTVIGKGSIIGGNTWITQSVPDGTLVYNNNHRK